MYLNWILLHTAAVEMKSYIFPQSGSMGVFSAACLAILFSRGGQYDTTQVNTANLDFTFNFT